MADENTNSGGSNFSPSATFAAGVAALERGPAHQGEGPSFGLSSDADGSAVYERAPGGDFELALPDNFEGPPGFDFVIDESDELMAPIIGELRAFAHETGLNQEQFSKVLGMAAKRDALELEALNAASQREMRSLGPSGPQRVDALTRELTSRLGDVHAKSLLGVLFSKTQVEALEALTRASRGGGTVSPKFGGLGRGAGELGPDASLNEVKSAALRQLEKTSGKGRR